MEIIIWAWEIQITQSIYVPEETSGHQGSNYFQMSIILSYIFLFPNLPPFVHPLPISPLPSQGYLLVTSLSGIEFSPPSAGKQENILGDPEVINYTPTTNYLYYQGRAGGANIIQATLRKSLSPYTYTFICFTFFPVGGGLGGAGRGDGGGDWL